MAALTANDVPVVRTGWEEEAPANGFPGISLTASLAPFLRGSHHSKVPHSPLHPGEHRSKRAGRSPQPFPMMGSCPRLGWGACPPVRGCSLQGGLHGPSGTTASPSSPYQTGPSGGLALTFAHVTIGRSLEFFEPKSPACDTAWT